MIERITHSLREAEPNVWIADVTRHPDGVRCWRVRANVEWLGFPTLDYAHEAFADLDAFESFLVGCDGDGKAMRSHPLFLEAHAHKETP